jgi:hypothetical protein
MSGDLTPKIFGIPLLDLPISFGTSNGLTGALIPLLIGRRLSHHVAVFFNIRIGHVRISGQSAFSIEQ